MTPEAIEKAESILGHEFNDKKLLIESLTHASSADNPFQHIGILSLEFHVDKLSRPLL